MMHVRLRTDHDRLLRAALELATERGWAVPFRSGPSESPRWRVIELSVQENTMDWSPDDVRAAFSRLAASPTTTGEVAGS